MAARPRLLLAAALCVISCAAAPDDEPVDTSRPDCDPIMPAECALPWPSNLYLRPDPSRATGYTLKFGPTSLPSNKMDVHVDPRPYERLDGYGVGSSIIVVFPNLDRKAMATESTIARSLQPDAPVLLLEVAADGKVRRVPYFVEPDALEGDPARQATFVRPAEILKEATRYVVAFRDLRDTSGAPIAPSPAFRRLRDGRTADIPALAERQARFDPIFAVLEAQGAPRASLTLAWDFVTASSKALHGDLLFMRDDALTRVGPKGPLLTVTKTTEYVEKDDGSGRPVDPYIALEIEGTFAVPNYLSPWVDGQFVGSRLRRDAMGRPAAEGERTPRFWVRVPRTALGGAKKHGLVMYGHGLLGSGTQVRGSFNSKIASDHGLIFFAADLYGMSEEDSPPVRLSLLDLSRFPSMAERLQQGIVEWVLLTRAMRERLADLSELATRRVQVNKDEVFYSGISQGGIFGATFMAVTPDVTYGHLGVPGNNYSLLLQRSVDFAPFFLLLDGSYPTPTEHDILLSMIGLLWEATDPVSHLRHITAQPHPGNQPHHVLLAPARGDYQVAVVTDEIAARSGIGIDILANYDNERAVELVTPAPYPHRGSGVVLYSFGNPWPPAGNQPPKDSVGDPHGKPRRSDAHNRQMVEFFRTGQIIDVCGGDGCRPD
jgi:hypothetical protein